MGIRGKRMSKGTVEFVKDDEYYTPKETLEFFGGGSIMIQLQMKEKH